MVVRLSVSVRALLVVDAIGATVHVVHVLIVTIREPGRVDATGDEAPALSFHVRPQNESLDDGPDRRPRQRDAEQEADTVGHEAGREQKRAGGDEQAAVQQLFCRHLAGHEPSLEAVDRVSALGSDQQHTDQPGENDQRDGHGCADGVGDDDEQQGVGQRDEQQEREHPAQAHTAHFRRPTDSPFDARLG